MTFSTTAYCSLSDVKVALRRKTDGTDSADDAFIQSLIPQAQAFIDRYVGYSFQTDGTAQSPSNRVYSGQDQETLMIDYCQQIVTVTEQMPVLTTDFGGNLLIATPITRDITADCILGPENRSPGYLLVRASEEAFAEGRQNITVSGVWGFTSVPDDINRACIRLTAHYLKMADTNYADATQQGQIRTTYHKQVPADVMEILEQRKRRLFLAWG